MGKEIERKFLVRDIDFLKNAQGSLYRQGYLSHQIDGNIRVRRAGDHGYITIKSRMEGCSRHEFEYEIPAEEADELMQLFCSQIVEKTRYLVPFEGKTWEVDIFAGDNEGLIIAEIELESEDETFTFPDWVGAEVTQDGRYFNSQLAQNPFKKW